MDTPTVFNIDFVIPDGKFGWLLYDKIHWVHSWGYKDTDEDREKLYEDILYVSRIAYINGNYRCRDLGKYGYRISLDIDLPGVNERKDEVFKLVSGQTIFPDGHLKINTFVGGYR